MRLSTIVNAQQALKELLDNDSKNLLPITILVSAARAYATLSYELKPLLEKEINLEVSDQT